MKGSEGPRPAHRSPRLWVSWRQVGAGWARPPSWVIMAVSAQLLVEELEIFGLECEEALVEKCESLAPLPGPQPRFTLPLGSEVHLP